MSVEAFERARDRLGDRAAAAVDADRELGSIVITAPVGEVLRRMASDLLEPDVLAHWLSRLEEHVNEVGISALEYVGVDVAVMFERAKAGDEREAKALHGYFGTLHGALGQQLLMGLLLAAELEVERIRADMDAVTGIGPPLEVENAAGVAEAMATPLELHRLVPAHESYACEQDVWPPAACDGSSECRAPLHIEGCYAGRRR